ncbi:nitroreductase/quinone reductase family protein [Rhodococcus maanshanensis]|uniref:nitroreductase/quinone reductase family protein n=1 Tax=Rhodococcus maanshanensis TaxID=183556 RepID=UPI0009FAFEF3
MQSSTTTKTSTTSSWNSYSGTANTQSKLAPLTTSHGSPYGEGCSVSRYVAIKVSPFWHQLTPNGERIMVTTTPPQSMKRRLVLRVSRARLFPRIAKYIVRLDEYITRGGNYQNSFVRRAGMKPVILYIPGRKTGTIRPIRLLSIRTAKDEYVVVGSNWGKPNHPLWSTNLLEAVEIDAIVRGEQKRVQVHHITGAERDALWPRLVAEWPNFEIYQTRANRELRVFMLQLPTPDNNVGTPRPESSPLGSRPHVEA